MKTAIDFLRGKQILSEGCTKYIVKYSDGRTFDFVDIMEEYANQFKPVAVSDCEKLKVALNNVIPFIHDDYQSVKDSIRELLNNTNPQPSDAVEFAEWKDKKATTDEANGVGKWMTMTQRNLTMQELYELFKQSKNK